MLPSLIALAPPAELSVHPFQITEIRGPSVLQIRRAVFKQGGEAAWNHLLATVSEPTRERFQRPLTLYEWVDIGQFTELSLAYRSWSQRDDIFNSGRAAAREELTTLHRWMLRMMTPEFLINSLPRMFAHYIRGGRIVVDELGSGHAHLSLWSEGVFPEWYHPGITGWLESALEITGASGVVVNYKRTGPERIEGTEAPRHSYRLAWRA